MSWYKVTLPLLTEIDPQVVEIGDIVREKYLTENMPKGFAMYHATRGSVKEQNDKMLVYLTQAAYELCGESVGAKYTLEPCDVPARDEPNIAFVLGDPHTMHWLKENFEPEPGTVEWERAQILAERIRDGEARQAAYEAEQAAAEAKAKADAEAAAKAEAEQAESAQA